MAQELFQNQTTPTAILTDAIGPTDTECKVSSLTNFSGVTAGKQFRMSIQDTPQSPIELVLVTDTNGTTFTIQRGIEGSNQLSHLQGALCAQVVTKAHMDVLFPAGIIRTASGNFSWPNFSTKIVVLNQLAPGPVNVIVDPTALTPYQEYSLVDAGKIGFSQGITITPLTGTIAGDANFPFDADGQTVNFITDGTNLWLI